MAGKEFGYFLQSCAGKGASARPLPDPCWGAMYHEMEEPLRRWMKSPHGRISESGKTHDRSGLLDLPEEVQCGLQGLPLPGTISRLADRPPHQVGSQHHPGQSHHFQEGPKGADGDQDGGNSTLLQKPGNVSHGNLAAQSSRNKDGDIH